VKTHRTITLILASAVLFGMVALGRADEAPRTVDITAKRFEFVPNTITLKKGETVTLRVTSEDVIHGLFLRDLKLDTDIEPGETQELTVTPRRAGKFTAICHHFCGAQHGNMKLTVVVEE
jgi:cytochrome c oxidase subunit II